MTAYFFEVEDIIIDDNERSDITLFLPSKICSLVAFMITLRFRLHKNILRFITISQCNNINALCKIIYDYYKRRASMFTREYL